MSVHIDVSQVDRLAGDLIASTAVTATRASAAVRKTAHDIEASAKALAPVDTGFLRNSISTAVSGAGASTTAVVGPTAEYGIYQELGTSRMAAQPYLGPAFDQQLPGFAEAVAKIGGQIL